MASTFRNDYFTSYVHDIPSVKDVYDSRNTLLTKSSSPTNARNDVMPGNSAGTNPQAETDAKVCSQPVVKTLEFRKRIFNSDLFIWHRTEWHDVQEYVAQCSEWKGPDVTLYATIVGQEEPVAVLGVAHFRHSRHVRFGIGDAKEKPGEVIWEEMRNISKMLGKSKYAWQFTEVPEWKELEDNTKLRTRRFKWQRTNSAEDGIASKRSLRSYRLTDEETGGVVAVFAAGSLNEVRKRGELRLYEELRPKVEMAIILTCASIAEKSRRD